MLLDAGGEELVEGVVAVEAVEDGVDPVWGVGAVELGDCAVEWFREHRSLLLNEE